MRRPVSGTVLASNYLRACLNKFVYVCLCASCVLRRGFDEKYQKFWKQQVVDQSMHEQKWAELKVSRKKCGNEKFLPC